MGVDIYLFVEVDWGRADQPFATGEEVRGFNLGEFFIWQSNLAMYYALGLGCCTRCRRQRPPDECDRPPLFPLRGLPPNIGNGVMSRYFHIVDTQGYSTIFEPILPTVGPEEAEQWVAAGASQDGPPLEIARGRRGWESLRRVSCPDWHCTNWLTLAEFRRALVHHGVRFVELGPCVHAIVAAMEAIESRLGMGRTRLVYWFDNMPW
jgi:hypothetical protein